MDGKMSRKEFKTTKRKLIGFSVGAFTVIEGIVFGATAAAGFNPLSKEESAHKVSVVTYTKDNIKKDIKYVSDKDLQTEKVDLKTPYYVDGDNYCRDVYDLTNNLTKQELIQIKENIKNQQWLLGQKYILDCLNSNHYKNIEYCSNKDDIYELVYTQYNHDLSDTKMIVDQQNLKAGSIFYSFTGIVFVFMFSVTTGTIIGVYCCTDKIKDKDDKKLSLKK